MIFTKRKKRFFSPGIEKQIEIARRHRDFEEGLVWRVASQGKSLASVQATPESRRLYNLYSQVMGETNRLACYLRLQINSHGILHASHTPVHQVEDLLVSHFLYRFPKYVVVLVSKRGTFVGRDHFISRSEESVENVIGRLERELPVDPILKELKETDDEVWEAFYQSQYVKEKHNQGLFLRNVPPRFLGMESFNVERKLFRRAKNLEGFLKEREGGRLEEK